MLVRLGMFAAIVALIGISPQKPVPEASQLESPWTIGREERLRGNPLAGYVAMLRYEKEYLADPRWGAIYPELRAFLEQRLGDPKAVGRGLEAMLGDYEAGNDLKSSPLDRSTPKPAVPALLRAIGGRRIVMVGEEHHSPQSRALVTPLLRELRKRGFRYYAAETFETDVAKTGKQGYPTDRTGTYSADPVFAESIREAIRLGYTLVPYERADVDPNLSAMENQVNRERGQAENLKARIFDRDPKAKVFVHAGRGHVAKGSTSFGQGEFKLMGGHLWEMTGIEPFSIYLAGMIEHEGRRRQESPVYRYADAKGWIEGPTVFEGPGRKLWAQRSDLDADVFFPRVRLVAGRPDWMRRDLGRRLYRLPATLLRGEGLRLVQARPVGEPSTSVPTDQVLLRPGEPAPALMLPKGRFRLRTIDPAGTELGIVRVRI